MFTIATSLFDTGDSWKATLLKVVAVFQGENVFREGRLVGDMKVKCDGTTVSFNKALLNLKGIRLNDVITEENGELVYKGHSSALKELKIYVRTGSKSDWRFNPRDKYDWKEIADIYKLARALSLEYYVKLVEECVYNYALKKKKSPKPKDLNKLVSICEDAGFPPEVRSKIEKAGLAVFLRGKLSPKGKDFCLDEYLYLKANELWIYREEGIVSELASKYIHTVRIDWESDLGSFVNFDFVDTEVREGIKVLVWGKDVQRSAWIPAETIARAFPCLEEIRWESSSNKIDIAELLDLEEAFGWDKMPTVKFCNEIYLKDKNKNEKRGEMTQEHLLRLLEKIQVQNSKCLHLPESYLDILSGSKHKLLANVKCS